MLLAIRDRAKGWVAWAIVVLIAIPFAFAGVYNYLSGPSPNIAATVDGHEIMVSEVNNLYRQQRQQLQSMFGDQFDPEMFDDRQLRRDAVEQLINERLLAQYVQERGFRITDQQLAALIRSQEVFHENGRFSPARYRQLLQANMLSPERYEAQLRRAQALDQLQNGIFGTALITDADVDRVIRIERQRRDFAYLTVASDAFLDPAAVDDAAVEAYYDENPQLFQQPEEVRLEYLRLDESLLREQAQVEEAELRQRYQEQRETRFTEPGEREVRHILLSVPENAGADQVAEARERLQQMREEILAGADFEELAREHSDDPGSAQQGGDLGVVERGMMVEPFEEAAFALEEGEISEPVRTPFGVHLLQVTRAEPAQVRSFEEVRERLEDEMIAERVGNRMFTLVEQLGNLTYESPETLEPAAQELGLEVRETEWFSRDGGDAELTQNPRVVQAAFSEDVLEMGYNSEPLNLGEAYVVVRVADHRPATRQPLAEVADEVRQRLARERAQEQALALATELRERAEAGEAVDALQAPAGVTLTEARSVERSAADHPAAVLQQVFRLPRPDGEQASVGQVRLRNGDVVVIALSAVQDGEPSELAAEEREQYRYLLQQAYGEAALADLMAGLRADARVQVYENRL